MNHSLNHSNSTKIFNGTFHLAGAMMSGFEITSMILTPSQTHLVQLSSNILQPQCVLPCHSRSANQTSPNVALSSPL